MLFIRILREYERGVVFRLGRLIAPKGPGLILLIPFVDRMVKVDLRTITMEHPAAGGHYPRQRHRRGSTPSPTSGSSTRTAAVTKVDDFLVATSQIAQTTLRSVLGQAELDELLSEREQINHAPAAIIDEQTEPWGIKVTSSRSRMSSCPPDDAARDGPPGRGRAREARQDHRRRRRVPGREKLAEAADVISSNPPRSSSATCRR